jgi:hypothetical protein
MLHGHPVESHRSARAAGMESDSGSARAGRLAAPNFTDRPPLGVCWCGGNTPQITGIDILNIPRDAPQEKVDMNRPDYGPRIGPGLADPGVVRLAWMP